MPFSNFNAVGFLRHSFCFGAILCLVTAIGCGPSIPPIVPVSGRITVGGKPLPNVEVKFIPMQTGLDGNTIASGVTDADGKYSVRLPGSDKDGACACETKVTITEGPIPDEVRNGEDSQMAATEFLRNLANRPIPTAYNRVADTPLTIVVEAGKTYDFDLVR